MRLINLLGLGAALAAPAMAYTGMHDRYVGCTGRLLWTSDVQYQLV
jgi:hypothetical protein